MTQSEVAEKLRLQRTSLSNIESGNQVLVLDVFYDLCRILEVNPGEILNSALESTEPMEEIEKIIQQTNNDDNASN